MKRIISATAKSIQARRARIEEAKRAEKDARLKKVMRSVEADFHKKSDVRNKLVRDIASGKLRVNELSGRMAKDAKQIMNDYHSGKISRASAESKLKDSARKSGN